VALTQIDGATFPPGQLKDRIESELWGFDGTNWRRVAVTAGGNFVVSSGAVAPGVVITSPADTALPAGVVPLPVPPVGTTRMTVQVTAGDAATRVRVRELGGLAGAGVLLTLLASRVYGSDGGSVEPLEVELVAGAAAAIAIQFEG
jgi:hypothetical protein